VVRLAVIVLVLHAVAGCAPQVMMSARERGDSFLSHGLYDSAIYWYSRAIDAQDTVAYAGRSMAYAHEINLHESPSDKPGSNMAAALGDADRAVALYPKEVQSYINRGVLRAASGQLEGALADMNEAMRLNQGSAVVYGHRGLVLLRMGRDAEGDADIARCLYQEPAARREIETLARAIRAQRGKN
jgi:tetratricopeptide (TPR) repeat protein